LGVGENPPPFWEKPIPHEGAKTWKRKSGQKISQMRSYHACLVFSLEKLNNIVDNCI